MQLTPELENHLNNLITLFQYNVFELTSYFNNYIINMLITDVNNIEVTLYNKEGDIVSYLRRENDKWIC